MSIKTFARAEDGGPWSSLLSGMFSSLQPVKRSSRPDDTSQAPQPTTPSVISRNGTHQRSFPSTSQAPQGGGQSRATKRRKISSTEDDAWSTLADTRATGTTTKANTSAPRRKTSQASLKASIVVAKPANTIDRYFIFNESVQTDAEEKPPISLYDAIQQRVHEAEVKSEDKRTLRSQNEGSRLKSELAVYFPNYEDVINDVPKKREVLTPDTVLVLKDGPKKTSTGTQDAKSRSWLTDDYASMISSSDQAPEIPYNGAELFDFSDIEKSVPHHPMDPLTDSVYFPIHRRSERREKQLRNIERERAMHEKVQLERLLDNLQGHDWLRVMGVSGITESEAQRYQDKRSYFIREVAALVKKFKDWREEEKRQKFGNAAIESNSANGNDEDNEESASEGAVEPSSSEIDASAARQLLLEASGSSKSAVKHRHALPLAPVFYRPPTPEGPFTSFFAKPHLREAAIGGHRHGRSSLAFGQAIPDLEEMDFNLPADYTNPANLKEAARRRRRMKRESIMDAGKK